MTAQPKYRLPGVVYHPEDVAGRYHAAGVWPDRTLGDMVRAFCRQFADRTAILGPEGSRYSFAEIDRLSDRYAAALLASGLRPLDRAIVQMLNVPELLVTLYALWKAGVIPVCTIAAYREHEIELLAAKSGARAHIVQGDCEERHGLKQLAKTMRNRVGSLAMTVVVRGEADGDAVALDPAARALSEPEMAAQLAAVERDPFQVAMFQLSGGSTGIPKIIPRFHSEYAYQVEAWARWSGFDAETVTFWPLPAMHNAAMACLNTPTHVAGGAVVMSPWSNPMEVVQAMVEHRPTVTGLALPHIVRLKEAGVLDKLDFDFIKQCFSQNEAQLIEAEVKVPGYNMFGMGEGILMRTLPSHPLAVRYTTVGEPLLEEDEVRLIDPETLVEVAIGEVGEYCCRGPYTIRGYYDDPVEDAERFLPDGFLRSGDLMKAMEVDGRRYFTFVGRLKDNINRMGEKIGAKDVEDLVRQHPAVFDVAAIGMPDPVFGERVCVYIIPAKGAAAPSVAELADFLRARGVAKFKWPERIETIAELPVSKLGKVSKQPLKDDIAAKLAAERASASAQLS